MSVCLYRPGGGVGSMFGRPKIANNDEMNAGGLKIEVIEPFKKLRLTYEGKVCLMDQPFDMADPSRAFRATIPRSIARSSSTTRASARCSAAKRCARTANRANWTRRSRSPAPTMSSTSLLRVASRSAEAAFHAIDGYGLRDKS